jgi:hypothetical protein
MFSTREISLQRQATKAMLKNLQTMAAVAIIAFFCGFIAARHPLVRNALDNSAQSSDQSDNADSPTAPQPVEPIKPLASMPSENTVISPVPVFSANARHDESSSPLTRLTPVPIDLSSDGGMNSADGYSAVRRLPPVYGTAPMSAGRYAAEYPPSPIAIYPSTGF